MNGLGQRIVTVALRGGVAAFALALCIESDGTSSVDKFGYRLTRGRWSRKGTVKKQ